MNLEETDEVDGQVQNKLGHDSAFLHVESLFQYLGEKGDASHCDKIFLNIISIPNK